MDAITADSLNNNKSSSISQAKFND